MDWDHGAIRHVGGQIVCGARSTFNGRPFGLDEFVCRLHGCEVIVRSDTLNNSHACLALDARWRRVGAVAFCGKAGWTFKTGDNTRSLQASSDTRTWSE